MPASLWTKNNGFPAIISELVSRKCQVPAFETFLFAAGSWDHHLMEMIPPLRTVIADHAGQQFTPANPIVVVGMATPDFVTEARPVDVAIDLNDLDPANGYKVSVKDNPKSLISLVEEVDPAIFQKEVLEDLQRIAAAPAADSSECVLPVD